MRTSIVHEIKLLLLENYTNICMVFDVSNCHYFLLHFGSSSSSNIIFYCRWQWRATRPEPVHLRLLGEPCSGVSTGGEGAGGTCPPDFRPRGTVTQKSPTFLTHSDTTAGSTSQSLGLPAYACKSDGSTAIKLAPRLHQNLPF